MCVLCDIDATPHPEDDRRLAYFIVGAVSRPEDPEDQIDLCGDHTMGLITALALIGEVTGHDGPAKQIRAIGTLKLVPPLAEDRDV